MLHRSTLYVSTMEPSSQKLDEDVFDLFRRDNSATKKLKHAREYLARQIEGFLLLKLTSYCNGHLAMQFSDACCTVTRSVGAGINTMFYYESVFGPGFRILDDYMKSWLVPEDPVERMVLKRLLTFLLHLNDADNALNLKETETVSETEWTVRLTHHLLSPLAADQNYMHSMDKHAKISGKDREKCPCCGEQLQGQFADTSIGNTDVWHGPLDVILGTKQNQEVAIHVAYTEVDIQDSDGDVDVNDNDGDGDGGDETDSIDEPVETVSQYRFHCQLISETIVFSYLQKQFLKEDSNTLIPSIGVTKGEVYIFMYDHKLDMMLESTELKLRKKAVDDSNRLELSVSTVVALWLAINYKYLCSGTPDSMRRTNYTADFPKLVPSVYQIYENGVTYCCGKGKEDETYTGFRSYEYEDISWSN